MSDENDIANIRRVADDTENLANHANEVAEDLDEAMAHVKELLAELGAVATGHAVPYDNDSTTGTSTRGVLVGAETDFTEALSMIQQAYDLVNGRIAPLHTAAGDMRDHAARIEAAGLS